jgi:hypothetical protein
MPAPLKTLKERKARYKEVIKLLEQGHTMTSAGKLVGLTQPAISRIAKSYGFKRRVNAIEQVLLGKVKSSLVKRAVGYKTTKEYQQLDRNGNVVDLIEEIEVPGDVKAQLAYLQAKDKDGGWINNNNGTSITINQALQGVSTSDLLLTLRTGAEQLKAGGEGVPMVSGEVVDVDVGWGYRWRGLFSRFPWFSPVRICLSLLAAQNASRLFYAINQASGSG